MAFDRLKRYKINACARIFCQEHVAVAMNSRLPNGLAQLEHYGAIKDVGDDCRLHGLTSPMAKSRRTFRGQGI